MAETTTEFTTPPLSTLDAFRVYVTVYVFICPGASSLGSVDVREVEKLSVFVSRSVNVSLRSKSFNVTSPVFKIEIVNKSESPTPISPSRSLSVA